jgi:hypothetical protein
MHLMKEASPRFQRISSPRSAKSAQCWWLVLGRRLWQAWLSFWLRSSKVWTFLSRSHKLWLTDICTLGFKSKVEAYEVEARLTACQKVEFVPQEAAIYKDTTTHHLFFVVLRDGTKWAIDLCNAQFCATTTLDHESGVFPWADYMRQLKATPEDIIDVRPLLANKDTLVDMDLVGLPPTDRTTLIPRDQLHAKAEMLAILTPEGVLLSWPIRKCGTIDQLFTLPTGDYNRVVGVLKEHYSEILAETPWEMFEI